MGMPNDLILVRHGESEGNVATNAAKIGDNTRYTDEFITTPGHQWRLTELGRAQAAVSGAWLREHVTAHFDRCYVSPYVRTRETAGHLALPDARWMQNRALRERDWGDIGSVLHDEFNVRPEFALNAWMKRHDPLYWRPPGGESIAGVAEDRVRNVLSSLHRETTGQRVIAVTHGEAMWAFRIVLERMDDERFIVLDSDRSHKIRNCAVLHYTRIDPVTGVQAKRLSWLRRSHPVVDSDNPQDWHMSVGEWEPLEFATHSNAELLAGVARIPTLFPDTQGPALNAVSVGELNPAAARELSA